MVTDCNYLLFLPHQYNNNMNNTLFRASQLGKLMTDARTKSGLSETTKSALLEVYVGIVR